MRSSKHRADLQLFLGSPEITPEFNQYLSKMVAEDPAQLHAYIMDWGREVAHCVVAFETKSELSLLNDLSTSIGI